MSAAELLLILAVLTVAALTAGGMAMRSVSRIWLRHWVEQQLRGSSAALVYLERPQRLIIAASATVALILVLSGILVASDHSLRLKVLASEMALYAVAVVVLGQLLPRAVARRFAPQVASLLSPLMEAAALIAAPVVIAGRFASRRFENRSLAERDTIQDLLREGELEGVGEREEMVDAFGLDERRAALVVLRGIGLAGGEEFSATLGDKGFVFAMGGDDDAEFLGELERSVEFGVVDAERTLVGEEDFERADPAPHDLAELRLGGGVELGDTHVE